MEWRCEWCGKPHAEDDPPCDNCGHGQFERAVVPAGPEGDGGPLVWVCTDCGREHPRNNPPCSRCGHMTLEKQRQDDVPVEPLDDGDDEPTVRDLWVGDDEDDEPPETMTVWACTECGRAHPRNNPPCGRCGAMTFEQEERAYTAEGDWRDEDGDWHGGDEDLEAPPADHAGGTETMTTWVCTECGRSHPRNNPPCSRCGGMQFERREQEFDDLDAAGGGWLDAVDAKVLAGFAAVILLAVLVVGPATGAFDLPGQGPPAVENVPGEGETVDGIALADVERSFLDGLNDERTASPARELSWNRELALFATYRNQWSVKAAYQTDAVPAAEGVRDAYRSVDSCDPSAIQDDGVAVGTVQGRSAGAFDSAEALAAALVDVYVAENDGDFLVAENGKAGVDVHVGPDGRVFVTVAYC